MYIYDYVKDEEIRMFIANLTQHVKKVIADQNEDFSTIHNTYTNYCLVLSLYGCGHRPVSDILCCSSQLDLDEGLALISDKVVSESREYRLVALPDLLCKQIKYYKKYLKLIASRISQISRVYKDASVMILSLLDVSKPAKIPLFFNLDRNVTKITSIRPASIMQFIEPFWPLPCNYGRHYIASEMLNRMYDSNMISLQIGHFEGMRHPFGILADSAPLNKLNSIRNSLNSILESHEWEAVPCPGKGCFNNLANRLGINNNVDYPVVFGPEKRRLERQQKIDRCSKVVRNVIDKSDFLNLPKSDKADEFFNIAIEIINEAEINSLSRNRCLSILYRWMNRYFRKERWFRKIRRIYILEPDPSPINAKILINYRLVRELRNSFESYLKDNFKNNIEITVNKRIAEIILSAAIFGGLSQEIYISNLCSIFDRFYSIKENLICCDFEYKNKQGNKKVYRWIADPISTALISGFYKSEFNKNEIDYRSVKTQLKHLLNKLINIKCKNPYRYLAEISTVAMTLEGNGVVSSISTGKIRTVSLPKEHLIRILTGQRLLEDPTKNIIKSIESQNWSFPIFSGRTTYDIKTAKQFIDMLKKEFSIAKNIEVVGNKKKKHVQKKELLKRIAILAGDGGLWPDNMNLVLAWILHMCKKGTSQEGDPAFSTINKYAIMVGEPLIYLARGKALIHYDSNELNDLYSSILDFKRLQSVSFLVGRINDFHDFITCHFVVDQPDWQELYGKAGCLSGAPKVDANFLTYAEYISVLNHINSDDSLSEYLKIKYSCFMILGFRFGLRFDEAYQLEYRSIQYSDDLTCVYILVRGDVKYDASIRVIELQEALEPIEKDIFYRLLSFGESRFEKDYRVKLFSVLGSTRDLVDRSQLSMYMNNVLKVVTGTNNIHFHHLRHGFTCRMIDHSNGKIFFTSDKDIKRLKLNDISTIVGHVMEETTVGSYYHLGEFIIYDAVQCIMPKMDLMALSYCLGTKYSTLRKRKARGIDSLQTIIEKEKIYKIIPGPDIETRPPYDSLTCAATITSKEELTATLTLDVLMALSIPKVSAEVIAERFFQPVNLINKIILTASEAEKKSGYNLYQLERRLKDKLLMQGRDAKYVKDENQAENVRVRKILNDIENKIQHHSDIENKNLKAGLTVWLERFEKNSNSLIVNELADIKTLTKMFVLIGLNSCRWIARASEKLVNDQELSKSLNELGIKVEIAEIRSAREKTSKRRTARIELSSVPDDTILTKKTLSKLMYILSVWQDVKDYSLVEGLN